MYLRARKRRRGKNATATTTQGQNTPSSLARPLLQRESRLLEAVLPDGHTLGRIEPTVKLGIPPAQPPAPSLLSLPASRVRRGGGLGEGSLRMWINRGGFISTTLESVPYVSGSYRCI